jgi:hypothetical protein
MGSKTSPSNGTCEPEPCNDSTADHRPRLNSAPSNMRIRLIVEALKVPPVVLYGAPNATVPRSQVGEDGAVDLDRQCATLANAYRRINDPDERRRLLALIVAAADQA